MHELSSDRQSSCSTFDMGLSFSSILFALVWFTKNNFKIIQNIETDSFLFPHSSRDKNTHLVDPHLYNLDYPCTSHFSLPDLLCRTTLVPNICTKIIYIWSLEITVCKRLVLNYQSWPVGWLGGFRKCGIERGTLSMRSFLPEQTISSTKTMLLY